MTLDVLEWTKHGGQKIDHFQVFGERRTGTNYVAQLIDDNLAVDQTTKYGWKHGYPTMPCIARSALLVIVVRDPLSWLSSLHNRPFAKSHEGLAFGEFLRTQWYDQYRAKDFGHSRWGYQGMPKDRLVANQLDRHPITGKRFENPLEMRSVKNACFLGLLERECNAVLVDYEMAKNTPADMLTIISERYDIAAKGKIDVPGHVGAKGRPGQRVSDVGISNEDMAFIRAHLDVEQETRLGFWEDLNAA